MRPRQDPGWRQFLKHVVSVPSTQLLCAGLRMGLNTVSMRSQDLIHSQKQTIFSIRECIGI